MSISSILDGCFLHASMGPIICFLSAQMLPLPLFQHQRVLLLCCIDEQQRQHISAMTQAKHEAYTYVVNYIICVCLCVCVCVKVPPVCVRSERGSELPSVTDSGKVRASALEGTRGPLESEDSWESCTRWRTDFCRARWRQSCNNQTHKWAEGPAEESF